MSNVRHHPKTETLADFAAGRLDEARSVVIASHLAFCPSCARVVNDFEMLGGAILDATDPVPMAADALEKILQKADGAANVVIPAQPASDTTPERNLPISNYLDKNIDDIQWKGVSPGMAQHVLNAEGYRKGVLRLLKIDPGTQMPKHTHKGNELTLILRGAYEDEVGEFAVGDLADLDGEHTHTPKAIGETPCICLIATDAPLKFKTLTGRLAQPFIGL